MFSQKKEAKPAITPIPMGKGKDISTTSGPDSSMVASSLDNITVAELTKAASAAVHKGDVMNSGAWNFKARIAVKRISPVVLEIFDGAERPTDTDAAA